MKKGLYFDFVHYISSSNQRQENEVWKPTKNLTQILHKLIIVCEFFIVLPKLTFLANFKAILLKDSFSLQKSVPLPASPLASAQSPKPKEKPPQLWKMSCLRPAPPTRPTVIQPDPGSKRNSITVKTNANKKGK